MSGMGKPMRSVIRLLVVEDDAAMSLILHDFLKNQGYAVTMSTSATRALKLLKSFEPEQQPNLVLSDVKLGAVSGIDLCREIGIDYPELPVVLFSVFDQFKNEALGSGARRFLKKPFVLEKLAEVVSEALNAN